MKKRIPRYLRLHSETPEAQASPTLQDLEELQNCRDCFARATGWPLQIDCESDPPAVSLGSPAAPGEPTIAEETAAALAGSLDRLIHELHATRQELRQREAELAAGVPVTAREDEQVHLAERLEAIIKGGAESVQCDAAAIYLLDDATSELKLRSAWNLPKKRFTEPPRPLRGAVADLEALVGHAVVLEDTRLLPSWKAPEAFAAAVCVPISTPSSPLGTLWIFSQESRDFSMAETNLIEIVAGRVAAELEREMLLNECLLTKKRTHDLAAASHWQHNRLPTIEPSLDGWQVAGWSSQTESLEGHFHDWSVLPDGSLSLAVGCGQGDAVERALNATTLQSALKAHARYRHEACDMIDRVNETVWASSVGDQLGSLAYALIHPEEKTLDYAGCQGTFAFVVQRGEVRQLVSSDVPVGSRPELALAKQTRRLNPGDVLVLCALCPLADVTAETEGFVKVVRPVLTSADGSGPQEIVQQLARQLADQESVNGYAIVALQRQ